MPDRLSSPAEREIELIRRVARRDRQAFAEIYETYRPRLVRFVSRMIRRADVAEEVANDAMVVVWQCAGRFRGSSRLSTWILGIGYRAALKRLRRSAQTEHARFDDTPTEREDAETILFRREGQATIRLALERLSPEHRAVVELTFSDDRSYAEIAQIVGCPENTVKTRMFHARRRLRRMLRNRRFA